MYALLTLTMIVLIWITALFKYLWGSILKLKPNCYTWRTILDCILAIAKTIFWIWRLPNQNTRIWDTRSKKLIKRNSWLSTTTFTTKSLAITSPKQKDQIFFQKTYLYKHSSPKVVLDASRSFRNRNIFHHFFMFVPKTGHFKVQLSITKKVWFQTVSSKVQTDFFISKDGAVVASY